MNPLNKGHGGKRCAQASCNHTWPGELEVRCHVCLPGVVLANQASLVAKSNQGLPTEDNGAQPISFDMLSY